MSTATKDLEKLSWNEHWLRIIGPVSGIIPILEGAMHFGPSYLCHNQEPGLTEHGLRFVAFLHPVAVEAHTAALDASVSLSPTDPGFEESYQAKRRLQGCVLVSSALLSHDLPSDVYAHDALDVILDGFRDAKRFLGRSPETPVDG